MNIDRIEIHHVAMPLLYPWRTAYGEDAEIESVLVKISSGDLYGWGEATPFAAPCYSPECAGGAFHVLANWLAPTLRGKQIESGCQLQTELEHFKGNYFAKAALDTAWWALLTKAEAKPLYELLGAKRDRVEVGADFGVMDDYDQLIEQMGAAIDGGFRRVKLKFRPGWDAEMLTVVRSHFPKTTIHIDCNSGYRLSDLEMFKQLDRFDLAMIEQPLAHDDLVDHAELARQISTPICLDESVCSLDRARKAIQLGSCKWINIKPGRVGGLTNAIAIHDLAEQNGVPCWVGGMLESSVGVSFCIALATMANFKYPADIFPSSRFYATDMADPETLLHFHEGVPHVAAATDPAGCPEPNLARMSALAIQSCEVVG